MDHLCTKQGFGGGLKTVKKHELRRHSTGFGPSLARLYDNLRIRSISL